MIRLRQWLLLIPLSFLILLTGCGSEGNAADEATTIEETTTAETVEKTDPSPSGENSTIDTELPVPSISLSQIYDPEHYPEDCFISDGGSSGGGGSNEVDFYVFVIEKNNG